MPRLTKEQVQNMKTEYNSGISPKSLMSKYNITKHGLYHHIDKDKNKIIQPPQNETEVNEPQPQPQSQPQPEDPLIDFEKLNKTSKQQYPAEVDFNIFDDIGDDALFNPDNLLKEPIKPKQEEKFSLKQFFTKTKEPKTITPEEQIKKDEEEQLKLVYQVRMYLYTFRDIDNLFSALNIDNNDKQINKYIQDLYKKKKPELLKLLDFIKFNVRHSNNTVATNFYSSIFFTVVKVFEAILTRVGVDLTGLSDDLKQDKDIIMNLKEIEIEMIGNKLNLGPKMDILLKICTKSVTKYTENSLINSIKKVDKGDITKNISSTLSCKPKNEILEKKYNDR